MAATDGATAPSNPFAAEGIAGRIFIRNPRRPAPPFRLNRAAGFFRSEGRGNGMKRIVAILAAALALAGCLPVTTKSPVGSTAGFKPDPALFGMWEGTPEETGDRNDVAFFAILPDKDGEATVVFIDMPVPVKSADWASYAVKTAALGPYRYLDAQARITDGKPADGEEARSTFPLLYRIEADGNLALYLLDEDATKAAVRQGRIAGTVGNGSLGDVVLTAAPKELDAFFASSDGRALFTKPLIVLHKVK